MAADILQKFEEVVISVSMKVMVPVPSPAITTDARLKHDAEIFRSIVRPTLVSNARFQFARKVSQLRKKS